MITLAVILLPAGVGLAAFFLAADHVRRALLVITAAVHLALTLSLWVSRDAGIEGWVAFDAAGLLFLTSASVLFMASAVYATAYLRHEKRGTQQDAAEHFLFINASECVFTGCLLLFLSTMSLVCASQRFGLLWVAIEATTLASAPLIYFHRHHRSLEATWKYLLICSVGIALALLGNFFLAVATLTPNAAGGGEGTALVVDTLLGRGPTLQASWLKAAFIFVLVGYGTKMGLAPMHTWLPDSHSESPSVVSALLSGALLNCAFLGILRLFQVCVAAGLGPFARELLILFGLISMAVGAIFILGQRDYKRMLAYSSVEHMGIAALGVGLGGAATYGALLHTVNHSVTKGMLFLLAGNIVSVYRSKSTKEVRGLMGFMPWTGLLWVLGFFAITGTPPFGTFVSELTILRAAFAQGHEVVAYIVLALLAVIFIGMATVFLRMAQGTPSGYPQDADTCVGETLLKLLPPAVLGGLALLFGVYIPPVLAQVLGDMSRAFGGA